MNSVRGFTLVEVMVALLVIGLTYAGLIAAVGQFADERFAISQRVPAYQVAWNRLATEYLVGAGAMSLPRNLGGDVVRMDDRDWRYRRFDVDSNLQGINLVEVEVEPANEKSAQAVSSMRAFSVLR